jgi:hypothetical protein
MRRAPYDHPDFTGNALSEDLFSASLGVSGHRLHQLFQTSACGTLDPNPLGG